MQHRAPQPYQNVASLPHNPQSRPLNNNQTPQQSYGSPNVFTPQSNIHSPFLNSQPPFPGHQASSDAPNYYQPNQSPRSQSSGVGPYYPAEKPDSMAATATMQRPYPPIYTPQSNSPASVTSPQSHDHGRPMYGQPGSQLSQPLYGYPPYQSMNQVHQPAYGGHHGQPQQHQMQSQPMLSYQSTTPQIPPGSQHHPTISSSPRLKESTQTYQQTPQARPGMLPQQQQPQQPTPNPPNPSLSDYKQTLQQAQQPQQQQQQPPPNMPPNMPPNSNAAPGPIPATTPLVVRQDGNGVQWIAFEYSRDRVKMEYTIRCDVESVDPSVMSQEFKAENCVYPRACVAKDQYKGNRLAYETDCNQVGWALAELNPCLRGKRGLIQRAVDSWRNSNRDPRLRSRRVRRQAKMNNRSKVTPSAASQPPGQAGPVSTGLPGPNSMPAPSTRTPGALANAPSQTLHHQQDVSPTAHNTVGASPYNTAPQGYRQDSASQHMPSPNDIRQSHVFPGYTNYPQVPSSMAPSMAPPMQGGLHHLGRPGGTAAMTSKDLEAKNEEDNALFGDLPENKRRKFILVEDTQKNARVRVKVTLDQIEMSEIPDSFRKQNSVFPRAYFPVQMQTAPESTRSDRFAEEGEEVDGGAPTLGKAVVSVQTTDGEAEVDVPQISKSKRGREQKINELGHRMAWGQGRVFSKRPIFLARALDAYRSKQRNALLEAASDPSTIPAHLETRPGKRKWLERTRPVTQPMTPPAATD
ncbi:hypothetical protein, variant 1 [Exophiala xenobiotica]|uniref:DUF8032 domain-containing protein n=2 Tax=Exophiala xenobiotica TaxID=348802 RepID=A0A0D2EB33_9EURO|nr:hypothetical protein, variant 1 [Exophiala xenobiotica]XP_013312471.1 uncharacterized protein PV05_10562 [Exophiala xenobiotica]KIW51884.1 hypothetical protein PV05_10562 [Exophiala xenobiotica]KIW51885.1 hypothetical protein, variant 1 [Exophiala xenobiotica]